MNRPSPLAVDVTTMAGAFTVTARFDAHPGITVLSGPSGSGKSLTLDTIAGLLRPTRGAIVLHGRTIADAAAPVHVPTQDRRIGMVTQHGALLPHRTPLDNVAIAVRSGDRRARRRAAGLLLDEVDAGLLAHVPTRTLSGGEHQRVALARALAGDPLILLLDEPFSALDQPARVHLRRLLRSVVDGREIPALIVTHDLDDAAALADRVVRYEPGRSVSVDDVTA